MTKKFEKKTAKIVKNERVTKIQKKTTITLHFGKNYATTIGIFIDINTSYIF